MRMSEQVIEMKKNLWIMMVLIFLLFITAGCGTVLYGPPGAQKTEPPDPDVLTLNRGDEAFRNEDYEKAIEIYSGLSQLAENEKIRRKALYGLACTKLILAETASDLNESIILWDTWSQLLPQVTEDEDPRMLKPILQRKALPGMDEERVKKRTNTSKNKISLKALEEKDNKILQLESQLKEMEKEIQKLKQQISSLEAIDQKIQEKKKEITSP
jgi:hypothetical protein